MGLFPATLLELILTPKLLNLLCLNSLPDADVTINIKDNNTFLKICLDSNSIPTEKECLLFLNLMSMMMSNLNTDIQRDFTLKVPLRMFLKPVPIISTMKVRKKLLMIKLSNNLTPSLKNMLPMPSDVSASTIRTSKKVMEDQITKTRKKDKRFTILKN